MPNSRLSRESREDSRSVKECREGDERAFESLVLKYQDQVYNVAYRMVGDREEAMDVSQETFIKACQRLETFDTKMPFRAWLLKITTNAAIDNLRKRGRSRETYTEAIGARAFPTGAGDESAIGARAFPTGAGDESAIGACAYPTGAGDESAIAARALGTRAGADRETPGRGPERLRPVALGGFDPPAPERENPENVSLSNETAGIVHDALWELPDNYRAVTVLHHLEGMSYSEIGKVLGVPRNTAKTWGHRAHGMLCESLEGVI